MISSFAKKVACQLGDAAGRGRGLLPQAETALGRVASNVAPGERQRRGAGTMPRSSLEERLSSMALTKETIGPYHEGELAVQRRAGVAAMAAKIGRGVHDAIAPGAVEFLAERTCVVVASRDAAGRVWASLLSGSLGFLDASEEHELVVHATAAAADPLRAALRPGALLGLVAIDFATRRRFRVNGSVSSSDELGFTLQVAQAFGNCPKYIQKRELVPLTAAPPVAHEVSRAASLSDPQRAWITSADTFFVATAHPERGADVSHRGGDPGFVRVGSAQRIVWPDYSGNTMFQTLGNLAVDPACGLLFPDFARGATLQLTGAARIVWDEAEARRFVGAERVIDFSVAQVIETDGVLPIGWRGPERSPYNPR
jgi:predicted pyridoxine 5'-phosphate oxidase superfamily flavin-nucleotide-binding protein